MEKTRVLTLDEAIQYDRKVVWLETRDTAGVLPVTYYAEHMPFLRFDCEDRVAMIEVRGEYYGKTWRCWNMKPDPKKPRNWKD